MHIYKRGVGRNAYFADCGEDDNSCMWSPGDASWHEATAVQREKKDCAKL